jgi:hypothetical protein
VLKSSKMLAYLPLLFAAAVAALPDSPILSRSALHSLSVREAHQKCDPKQRLVCCSKAETCSEVDMGSKYFVMYPTFK